MKDGDMVMVQGIFFVVRSHKGRAEDHCSKCYGSSRDGEKKDICCDLPACDHTISDERVNRYFTLADIDPPTGMRFTTLGRTLISVIGNGCAGCVAEFNKKLCSDLPRCGINIFVNAE